MQYRSSGIILKTQKLGEADRILKILTPEKGLVSAIAKGARRTNSSFAAKTQALNHCDFLLAEGKSLDIVSEVSIVNNFLFGCADLLTINLAFFMAEITEKVSIDSDSSGVFFELLDIYQRHLKSITGRESEFKTNQQLLLSVEFLWCLICELGYKPDLSTCALTRKTRSPKQIPQYFDLNSGSICSSDGYHLYRQGYHTDDHVIPLRKFTFKLLDALDKSPLSSFNSDFQLNLLNTNDKIKQQNLREILMEDFLITYMQVSLGEIKKGIGIEVLQEHQNDFSIENQNTELKSSLQLLYKHLEFQIHQEAKSWKALEEALSFS